jgi:hypothetical protein
VDLSAESRVDDGCVLIGVMTHQLPPEHILDRSYLFSQLVVCLSVDTGQSLDVVGLGGQRHDCLATLDLPPPSLHYTDNILPQHTVLQPSISGQTSAV